MRKVLNKNCDDFRFFQKTEYNGIVVRKFADPKHHERSLLELQNLKNDEKVAIVFDLDVTTFYDSVKIGDTLIKEKENDMTTILNNSGKFLYKIDFGCK